MSAASWSAGWSGLCGELPAETAWGGFLCCCFLFPGFFGFRFLGFYPFPGFDGFLGCGSGFFGGGDFHSGSGGGTAFDHQFLHSQPSVAHPYMGVFLPWIVRVSMRTERWRWVGGFGGFWVSFFTGEGISVG